jgi:hypothetical protein
MSPLIKNIIIFIIVAIAFILVYVFFIKPAPEQSNLVSTGQNTAIPVDNNSSQIDTAAAQDFLTVLLSVKSIKLDDSIFSEPAFTTLNDSNVVLTPDGTEGRSNPFAPIGFDSTAVSSVIPTTPKPTTTIKPVVPLKTQTAPTVN